MKIGIVTDTSCNFTPKQAEELGIHLIPLDIIFEDKVYTDAFEITTEEFYKKMSESDELPSTSQPAIGEFIKVYEKIIDDYDKVISIHLSGELSGTVDSARIAADKVDSDKIIVYDTKLVSVLSRYLVLEAKRLIDQGASLDDILERLDDARSKTLAYIVIGNLDNIIKGGRIPSLAGKVTQMIQIRPLIKISERDSITIEKLMRTTKRALHRLEKATYDYVDSLDYPVIVEVAHGDVFESAVKFKERLSNRYPDQEGRIHRLTGVIGVHSGPEILGFTVTPDYTKIDKKQ